MYYAAYNIRQTYYAIIYINCYCIHQNTTIVAVE